MSLTLRPHQWEACEKILESFKSCPHYLLADEVGLGKTRIACQIAHTIALPHSQVLIVAPLSTIGGWLAEAAAVGLDLAQPEKLKWPTTRAVIVNYEQLAKWKENFPSLEAVVWDEAHKLKSMKSKRFKLFESMARLPGMRMLFLTATPAQDPLEMKYLCKILGIDPSSYWKWVNSFRGIWRPSWGGFKFRSGHMEDQKRLKGVMKGPHSLRRTPQDIQGWPELNRVLFPVALSAQERAIYLDAFDAYCRAREAAGRSLQPKSADLVAVGQFRKALSILKVGATVELAETLMESGRVVTIHCEYLEASAQIALALAGGGANVRVIDGSTPSRERIRILQQSKADELDAIVFTVQEGINLHQMQDAHRPRVQIDHDIRWSALMQHQVDGRTHRAGRSAVVYWMVCKDAIDHKVAKRLAERMETMGAITGADVSMDEFLEPVFTKGQPCLQF